MAEPLPQLMMEKYDLDNVPHVVPPTDHVLRTYRPGDEEKLAPLYSAARLGMETAADVRRVMLDHPCYAPERLFVVETQGRIVGTAAAWREPAYPDAGFLHMLAVAPEQQGKGLGRALVVETVRYTRNEGFTVQRLTTDDWREAAIRLYVRLEYCPVLTHESHRNRWETVARELGLPWTMGKAMNRMGG